MRSELDALRSLIRYTSLALGDEWEVRMWAADGTFKFPFARVAATTPLTVGGPASFGDVTQGYSIHCYPKPGDTAEASLIEVARVKELLYVAFEVGFEYTDIVESLPVKVRSAKRRVPLYDYADVPLDGPNAFSVTRNDRDYLRVTDCPVEHGADPEDETQFRVIASPRLSWRRIASQPPDHGHIVESVRIREVPS